MKKLMETFKNLPPEIRMLIAMAGLGSLPAAYYLLAHMLGIPSQYVVIGILVVVAVIGLVWYLISKLFTRGARKRASRMENELLSAGASGPVSMDLRAAIKANNEKYFAAIRGMRKDVGISVYDLPWYIVIGDSGCGKTKLVNEGGLTFSTGKPEGYQLGTLNYNWWFTEDAVFVDMAGRLCNPQDDADRREWLAFLDTIARGRKGFPINGAICCVSAEHLLEDPPEKQEQAAITMLERCRDLQSRLGVTFATYLVVTKCDKILGFMQFFDRAERDLTVKNQIFGWSKPGTFAELYDPDEFANDFNAIYQRLIDLRTRRISDDVDEVELGLAYSFPEEFRTFRDPLKIYIQTLFPMVKNPKAIKNLIFRGLYFTSATQHGSVILKRLTERLGEEAAGRFEPLESLYPTPRPHFVKDLLFRKVFPEHGLVFRNEQQVIRSQRLARLLKVGSVGLAVLLFGILGAGFYSFNKAVNTPRQHAISSVVNRGGPQASLELTKSLHQDADGLHGSFSARLLFPFTGPSAVIEDLNTIQVRLFEEASLKPFLAEVDAALRSRNPAEFASGNHPIKDNAYLQAFAAYLEWLGQAESATLAGHLDALVLVATKAEGAQVAVSPLFRERAGIYFKLLEQTGPWDRNPARLIRDGSVKVNPSETVQTAVKKVHTYLEPYARLEKDLDGVVREWMRIRSCCAEVETSYRGILQAAAEDPATLEAFNSLRSAFSKLYQPGGDPPGGFAGGLQGCAWGIPAVPPARLRIELLSSGLKKQRAMWIDYRESLRGAYQTGRIAPPEESTAVLGAIATLTDGGPAMAGLDPLLWATLKAAGLTKHDYVKGYLDTGLEATTKLVEEVTEHYAHIIKLVLGDDVNSDSLQKAADAAKVDEVLKQIGQNLAKASTDPAGAEREVFATWIAEFQRLNPEDARPASSGASDLKLDKAWEPERLTAFEAKHRDWIARAEGTRLLNTVAGRLDPGQLKDWGSAELEPEWCKPLKAPFAIRIAACEPDSDGRRRLTSQPAVRTTPESTRSRRSRRDRGTGRDARVPIVIDRRQDAASGEQEAASAATREFWNEHYLNFAGLMDELDVFPRDRYLTSGGADPVRLCEDRAVAAFQRYVRQYVAAWNEAYAQKIQEVQKALIPAREVSDWNTLTRLMNRNAAATLPTAVSRLLEDGLDWSLRSTRWLAYEPAGQQPGWYQDQDLENWLATAFKDSQLWQHGGFAVTTWGRVPDFRSAPWVAVAEECKNRWYSLCDAIAKNADLGRVLSDRTSGIAQPRPAERIPWGGIREFLTAQELQDEKLTAQIAAFEGDAQRLLSRAMTQELCAIQTAAFQTAAPHGGWPYLSDPGDSLKTVEFAAFRRFLVDVGRAEIVFRPLDDGLPKGVPGKDARRQFYNACAEWSEFLLDEKNQPKELRLTLTSKDLASIAAGGKQRDTAQHFYKTVHLRLGLLKASDSVDDDPEKIPTQASGKARKNELYKSRDGRVPAMWKWRSAKELGEQDLFVFLEDGEPVGLEANAPIAPPCRLPLGRSSELALCAYLAHDGPRQVHGKEFEKEHWFNPEKDVIPGSSLPAELKKFELGARVAFVLDRPMPAPIVRLEPIPASPAETPR